MKRQSISAGISFLLLAVLACSTVSVDPGGAIPSAQVASLETVAASTAASTAIVKDPNCTNQLEFVTDVTVPDGTVYKPNAPFTKTWRIKNTGTCTWTMAYSLVFTFGEQMSAPDKVPFTEPIAPGEITDFSVNMTAPSAPGQYRGEWKLMNEKGVLFGFGREYAEPIFVMITVEDSAVANIGGQTGKDGNRRQDGQQGQGGNPPETACNPQDLPPELTADFVEKCDLNFEVHETYVNMYWNYGECLPIISWDSDDPTNAILVSGDGVSFTVDTDEGCGSYTNDVSVCSSLVDENLESALPDPMTIEIQVNGITCMEFTVTGDRLASSGDLAATPTLITVTPTLPGYQCSAGYHWCGEGTACCPNGTQCTYIKGNLYCK